MFKKKIYKIEYDEIENTNISLSSVAATSSLSQVAIDASGPGTIIVNVSGVVTSSPGDKVFICASYNSVCAINDGHIAVEAINTDQNQNSFSVHPYLN